TVGTVVFLSLRKLGALPLPLVRRGQGWGWRDSFAGGAIELTPHHPLPNPPPQGGRATPRGRRATQPGRSPGSTSSSPPVPPANLVSDPQPVSRPLSGLLVVALEQAVEAALCTCRLADVGARVIKVERPEGDVARYYDKLAKSRDGHDAGESAYFVWLNRGKE